MQSSQELARAAMGVPLLAAALLTPVPAAASAAVPSDSTSVRAPSVVVEGDCSKSFRIPPAHGGASVARVKVCYEAEWDPTTNEAKLRTATVRVENISTKDIRVGVLVEFIVSGHAHFLGACPPVARYQILKPDDEWGCVPDKTVTFTRPAQIQASADIDIAGQKTRTVTTGTRRI
ncbi:hypothetical protein ABZ924_21970 [Streptomyces sp. NPDC046876]|uniref:hypothetical protein n=1 Tax=Streptomyces sp. NPDC046876 TaxID=3155616 RepID=UPI0033C826C0